jgi:hypothetical protein
MNGEIIVEREIFIAASPETVFRFAQHIGRDPRQMSRRRRNQGNPGGNPAADEVLLTVHQVITPAYVDVAVKRWQEFTGQQAVLDGDGRTFDNVAAQRAR